MPPLQAGGTHEQPVSVGDLATSRESPAHQHPGYQSSEIIHSTDKHQIPHGLSVHRQCSCTVCPTQADGQIPVNQTRDFPSISNPQNEKHQNHSIQNFCPAQQQSGQSEQILHRFYRMGTPIGDIRFSNPSERSPSNRSHGNLKDCEVANIRLAPSKSLLNGLQRPSLELKQVGSNLLVSSQMACSPEHAETKDILPSRNNNSPGVPGGTLVPLRQVQGSQTLGAFPSQSNE